MRRVLALCALLSLAAPSVAAACAACACGDPTLTVMGLETPVGGRLRVGGELRYRSDAIGQHGVDRYSLEEVRLDLSASYAVLDRFTLALTVPLLFREGTDVSLATERSFGLGDLEARARYVVLRDRSFAPRHQLSIAAMLRVPTGAIAAGSNNAPISPEVRAGGNLDVAPGLAYAFLGDPIALFTSATLVVPLSSLEEGERGLSLRTTVAAQWQATLPVGLRLGVDGRLDAPGYVDGSRDPNSGGFIAFLSPDLLLSPATDWLVTIGVRVPVIDALSGHHDEGVALAASLVHDAML